MDLPLHSLNVQVEKCNIVQTQHKPWGQRLARLWSKLHTCGDFFMVCFKERNGKVLEQGHSLTNSNRHAATNQKFANTHCTQASDLSVIGSRWPRRDPGRHGNLWLHTERATWICLINTQRHRQTLTLCTLALFLPPSYKRIALSSSQPRAHIKLRFHFLCG